MTKGAEPDFGNLREKRLEAFQALKETHTTPPVLALPKKGRLYVADTDHSKYEIGSALLQQQDDNDPKSWVPVRYWFETLTPSKANYCTSERESLAVVWALKTLLSYLEETKFTVRTDHYALR